MIINGICGIISLALLALIADVTAGVMTTFLWQWGDKHVMNTQYAHSGNQEYRVSLVPNAGFNKMPATPVSDLLAM